MITSKLFSVCMLSLLMLLGCGETEHYEHVTYPDQYEPPVPDHVIQVPQLSLLKSMVEPVKIEMPQAVQSEAILAFKGTMLPPETNVRDPEIMLILIFRKTAKGKKGVASNGGGPVSMVDGQYPFEYIIEGPKKKGRYLVEIYCSCPGKLRTLATGILNVK